MVEIGVVLEWRIILVVAWSLGWIFYEVWLLLLRLLKTEARSSGGGGCAVTPISQSLLWLFLYCLLLFSILRYTCVVYLILSSSPRTVCLGATTSTGSLVFFGSYCEWFLFVLHLLLLFLTCVKLNRNETKEQEDDGVVRENNNG